MRFVVVGETSAVDKHPFIISALDIPTIADAELREAVQSWHP